jgi:NADH-quinone oxidoreductase subunit M
VIAISWLPWAVVGISLLGGFAVRFAPAGAARRASVALSSLGMLAALALSVAASRAPDRRLVDPSGLLGVDALGVLLVPLVALLGWTLLLAAPRRWAEPVAVGRLLLNLGLVSAAFLVRDARLFALLWAATFVPPYRELARAPEAVRAARVYGIYAALSSLLLGIGLLGIGLPLAGSSDVGDVRAWAGAPSLVGLIALVLAVFIRKAIVPFHSWLVPVFAAAPPGPVLLLVAPMLGAYALLRFAVPIAPELLGDRVFWLAPLALLTAAYAAGIAFVQTELRRIVAWIAISQSALVLVGLESQDRAGLVGGLVAWLSVAAAMTGLGLSSWMLEARFGPLSIERPRGLYRRSRAPALVFLLSGLSLVGFPGTVGFISLDLLLSAVLEAFPVLGLLLFFATALSGFTLVRTYLRLFHGPPAQGPELSLLPREWLALSVPLALIVWCGLQPAALAALGEQAARFEGALGMLE